ncbi:MAG: phage virion morphogenesis protein [Magnetococcales bacterium]|nr:phage virion morphogenesis protein [Magnetococcales bacterium]
MAGASNHLHIDIDDEKVRDALQNVLDVVEDPTELYKSIGDYLTNSTRDRFRQEESPEGVAWQELSPTTLLGKRKDDKRILKEKGISGGLMGRISRQASREGVRVGSNVVYAAIHQFGGLAGPKDRRVIIPARPYLGLSPEDKAEIMQLAKDEIMQDW